MFLWLCFQINMKDYPHFYLAKYGRLCSKGQHYPGFLRVLYDLPLSSVHGPCLGRVRSKRDDTL
jgi:hypothetical protein